MGMRQNITATTFPKQGRYLGLDVVVYFHYDTSQSLNGKIVRDDMEEPFETIIQLEDGRFVRSVECAYRPVDGY